MIELVIAAMIQVATLSSDVTTVPAPETTDATTTTSTTAVAKPITGGTGSWDDNN
jgi:hypothetical protein